MHKLSQNDHIDTHTHKHRHRETLDMHGSEREIMFRQREVFVYCKKTPRAPTKPNTRKPLGSSRGYRLIERVYL